VDHFDLERTAQYFAIYFIMCKVHTNVLESKDFRERKSLRYVTFIAIFTNMTSKAQWGQMESPPWARLVCTWIQSLSLVLPLYTPCLYHTGCHLLLRFWSARLSSPAKEIVISWFSSPGCSWSEASSALSGRVSALAWKASRKRAVRRASVLMAGCHLVMGEQELSVWGVRSQLHL
jgi:hypothetical protein